MSDTPELPFADDLPPPPRPQPPIGQFKRGTVAGGKPVAGAAASSTESSAGGVIVGILAVVAGVGYGIWESSTSQPEPQIQPIQMPTYKPPPMPKFEFHPITPQQFPELKLPPRPTLVPPQFVQPGLPPSVASTLPSYQAAEAGRQFLAEMDMRGKFDRLSPRQRAALRARIDLPPAGLPPGTVQAAPMPRAKPAR